MGRLISHGKISYQIPPQDEDPAEFEARTFFLPTYGWYIIKLNHNRFGIVISHPHGSTRTIVVYEFKPDHPQLIFSELGTTDTAEWDHNWDEDIVSYNSVNYYFKDFDGSGVNGILVIKGYNIDHPEIQQAYIFDEASDHYQKASPEYLQKALAWYALHKEDKTVPQFHYIPWHKK